MKSPRTKLPALADRFLMEEDYLSSPDGGPISCAVLRATDLASGDKLVLKYWKKSGAKIDADLREFWRHEMRQIERVRAYPGGDDVIIEILKFGETSDAFFLATAEDAVPLDHMAKRGRPDHWLRDQRTPRNRLTLWENIRRLAQAIGAMHGQGLIHGRIGLRSVYTTGRTLADVRLGGFEWCQRVTAHDSPTSNAVRMATQGSPVYSFQRDWRDLGALAASILGWTGDDVETEGTRDVTRMTELSADEIALLRSLLQPTRNREMDAISIGRQIETLIKDAQAEVSSNAAEYHLALRLGEQSKLSSAIRVASLDQIDTDDRVQQLAFVQADIGAGAQLCRDTRGNIYLLTETLAYTLNALPVGDGEEAWDIAVCNFARPRDEFRRPAGDVIPMPIHKVRAHLYSEAVRRADEFRSTSASWASSFHGPDDEDPESRAIRDALLLGLIAETLFRASEVVPVTVIGTDKAGLTRLVSVVGREDESRAKVSAALRVGNVKKVLERLFEQEENHVETEWLLTERPGLAAGGRDTARVRLNSVRRDPHRRVYVFETEERLPNAQELFLKRATDSGTEQAIRRRLRLLSVLATHRELSATLLDPRSRLKSFSEFELEPDEPFRDLDGSKQEALRSIWTTGPLQLVIGPPGVGKTKLVAELVRRILSTDRSAKILVSAQAHQALDNLVLAIRKAIASLPAGDAELVRSENAKASASIADQTPSRAKEHLAAMDRSRLAKAAPIRIQQELRDIRLSAQMAKKGDADVARSRRSFETSVLQSANIFCSTSNSGDLERLVEAGAQFDWVIIEEAAKATGSELLAPMLLSMRRVLVGDHNQLPPFDTDRIVDFLGDPTRVREALSESEGLTGSLFRDAGLDDLKAAIADDAKLRATSALAKRLMLPFESIAQEQAERQRTSTVRRIVVSRLAEQHRMHPAIAELVSHTFYSNGLNTDPGCAARFAATAAPFKFLSGKLPKSPIVFLSTPYAQKAPGAEEAKPAHTNPAEARAIVELLRDLRAGSNDRPVPSLAVLSPYNRQTRMIADYLEERADSELAHLRYFTRAGSGTGFCGSVDSFQGSEADLVVVSLVRNNGHVLRQALGFLSDPRRMNVLLSRAIHQLILVGSFEFFEVQARSADGLQRATGQDHYLPRLMAKLNDLALQRLPDGTPLASILDWSVSAGRAQ